MKQLSDRLPESLLKAIPCAVFSTREETHHWIKLKHTGENEGAGVVTWVAPSWRVSSRGP